jgi:NADH:ubiquinone oxidoreductase subunit
MNLDQRYISWHIYKERKKNMFQKFLTKLCTLRLRTKVGEDRYGNEYYSSKAPWMSNCSLKKERRWVFYKGDIEGSKVPAEWHGWLHFTEQTLPADNLTSSKKWIKPHKANFTGTAEAYRPKRQLNGMQATGDYQAWSPTGD